MGQHDKCRKHRRHDCHTQKVCKDKCKPITKHDFGCHKNETFVIRKPGYYCLKDDICFKPDPVKTQAVLIDSDDVVFDLCGHELKQGNNVTFCIGVRVKTGHQNVTILGSYGAIRNFSQMGLYVEGGNKDVTIGDPVTTLNINDSAKADNNPLTDFSQMSRCPETGVQELCFKGGMAIGETKWREAIDLTGKYVTYHGPIENVTMWNVNVERNMGSIGCSIGTGRSLRITNCSFSHNYENRKYGPKYFPNALFGWPENVTVYGLSYIGMVETYNDYLEDVLIENCDISFNLAESQDPEVGAITVIVQGAVFGQGVKNVTVRNSKFNQNETNTNYTNVFLRGCLFIGADCVDIYDTQFCGNTAIGHLIGQCEGFHASSFLEIPNTDKSTAVADKSVHLYKCDASNNITTLSGERPGSAFGFTLAFVDGGSLIDCVAENNRLTFEDPEKDLANGLVVGIFISGSGGPPSRNTQIRGCKVSKNTNEGLGVAFVGDATGIAVVESFNVSIEDTIVTENARSDLFGSRTDEGIFIIFSERVNIDNCTIDDHPTDNGAGIVLFGAIKNVVQNSVFGGNGIGVLLFFSECNVIQHNLLSSNDSGIVDTNDPLPTNLIVENKAFNTAGSSYPSYVLEGDSKSSGNLSAFPPSTGTLCVNTQYSKGVEDLAKDVHQHPLLEDPTLEQAEKVRERFTKTFRM